MSELAEKYEFDNRF